MLLNKDYVKSSYAIKLAANRNYQVEFRKRKLDESINTAEQIADYKKRMAEARERSKLKVKNEKLLVKLDRARKKEAKAQLILASIMDSSLAELTPVALFTVEPTRMGLSTADNQSTLGSDLGSDLTLDFGADPVIHDSTQKNIDGQLTIWCQQEAVKENISVGNFGDDLRLTSRMVNLELDPIVHNWIENNIDIILCSSSTSRPRRPQLVPVICNSQLEIGMKSIIVPPCVKKVYRFIQQATGSLGGNGSGGPIYGEITVGSMQSIINYLVAYCNFGKCSRFLDIGAGLGKPNFHVGQDPGVRLSIGVEVEKIRWMVSSL